jgi:hypothetical protein
MTPQSSFMVVAPLVSDKTSTLRTLLASMNHRPGVVDSQNNLVPFGEFDRLHFARFVVLDDQTLSDIAVHGLPRPNLATYLAFLGDCDGPADEFLAELTQRAGSGLRQIFSHCEGFASDGDLLRWMQEHEQRPAAMYVNWIGRTVRQIREENELRNALAVYLDNNRATIAAKNLVQIRDDLRKFVNAEMEVGRLTLTPPAPAPLAWKVRNFFHLVGVPVVLLLLAPFLLLYLPIFLVQLRCHERSDPEIVPRPDPEHVKKLADLEDHDVTNQFSALGGVKPGLFRRWTVTFLVWILDYGSRHIFNRGFLTRVKSIHFARWVFLDNKKRLFFASNYDGSLESYMDDFINKVAWGLNLVFSNGVGYPRSNWLVLNGAKDEQKFKHFIRRHELPTEVWYNAHPGLTAMDLERNTKIREGIEKPVTTEAEIREWLKLF